MTTNDTTSHNAMHTPAPALIEASIRPSIVAIMLGLLPVLLVLVTGYFGVLTFASKMPIGGTTLESFLTIFSYIIRLLLVLECARRYFNEVLYVTNQGLLHKKGLLSLSCTTASIQFSDIREVRVEQGIIDRIFGFGTLKVGTASMKDYEVVFRRMASAQKFARWLQKERMGDSLLRENRD